MRIDGKTKVCAVIGNPVEHSLSPAIHNAAFEELGLNFCYVAFRVEDLATAIAGVRALGIVGVSVTIPHKVAVVELLDEVDPVAHNIGSVNTLVNKDGKLAGYNSDGLGALKAIEEAGIDLEGKRVVILGSGGAARAIAFTLGSSTPLREITILGVKTDELEKLGADVSRAVPCRVIWEFLDRTSLQRHLPDSDGIIHCTPVGMSPNAGQSLVASSLLRPTQFVFDVVYTPLKTQLIKNAEEAGCRWIPGLEMFIHQAAFQFELWTGHKAPLERMRRVAQEHLE